MTGATLLVELLTEELPPKALPKLGQAFSNAIVAGLRTRGLAAADGAFRWFATPRRLAVTVALTSPTFKVKSTVTRAVTFKTTFSLTVV